MKSQFFSYRIFHYGAIWGVAGLWGVDPAPIPRENTPLTMGGTLILSPPWGSGGGGGSVYRDCECQVGDCFLHLVADVPIAQDALNGAGELVGLHDVLGDVLGVIDRLGDVFHL